MLWPVGFILKFIATILDAVLWIYFWVLIARVVISWIRTDTFHPLIRMVYQITEPVLAPVRRVIPPMGGLDLSVLIVSVFIYLVRSEMVPILFMWAQSFLR
ncbi:MAG: YggT family protein [Acidobacteria bacterium]|nr:YggT family protein [Acidobacteriota bacterium]MBI3656335.1 YggT family protein [Acidobacteriota bacterium]